MGKYRKILVPFDGSVSSKNALMQAIKLSQTEKSWIKVLAVVPSYEGELELVGVGNIRSVLDGTGKKLLMEATATAKAQGITILTNLEQGEAFERIVDVADSENCDLIIMGRKGVHNLKKMLMGSVTSRVISYANNDVLIVLGDASIGWNHILIATDGSQYSEPAIEHAINFASSYGGNLTAVSVVDLTDEFYAQAPEIVDKMIEKSKKVLEKVREKAEASHIKMETVVKEGESYQKIVEVAEEKGADVIFMGSHGRTGLKKLLMGSVTGKVIGYATCPVMVVKS
ncbi:MAG: universal stress protein [Candidatus Mariimomonas ferrooxydans]